MLKIDKTGKRLISFRNLTPRPLADLYELAEFLVNSPSEFFGEIDEDLFIIGTQVALSSTGPIAPVLAVDRLGCAVVASLDPPDNGSPLLQAMAAAGRVALWEPGDFHSRMSPAGSRALTEFLGPNADLLNQRQRIFLIAEGFSEDLLATASWLRDRYGIDAVCVEVALGFEPKSGDEFLEVADGQRSAAPAPAPDHETESGDDPFGTGGSARAAAAGRQGPASRPERRTHPRSPADVAVNMHVEYAGRRMGAQLRNYSDGGVGFVMQHPLPIGSPVNLQGELAAPDGPLRFDKPGRVRYCRYVNGRFLIGAAFQSTTAQAGGAAGAS